MSIYRYRQYRATLKAIPFKGRLMPYKWGALPTTLPALWMPYAEMFEEFSRELANIINSLSRYTHQLAAWQQLVSGLDDDGKLSVAVEFVDPLATVALNLPYVIRSRFIFATAHLCHQASRTKSMATWKDDLPLDTEIFFEVADKTGRSWKKYVKLKTRLESIGGKEYQRSTLDFRNSYNHRFSPRIVIGQTQIVTRMVDPTNNQVSYGFGGAGPLSLELVVKLLEHECGRCYLAFDAFKKLVAEHEGAIVASIEVSSK